MRTPGRSGSPVASRLLSMFIGDPQRQRKLLAPLLVSALCLACPASQDSREESHAPDFTTPLPSGWVDEARLAGADQEPGNWFTNGRDAAGSYYSPLDTIDKETVTGLGFAWEHRLGTRRGLEATPIVIDGRMYAVGNWGHIYALDARSGEEVWEYDPKADGQWGRHACCDAVNRGLAVWKGRIYVGSLDGFLHAVDADTGELLWKVDTLDASARANQVPYTITGAPHVAGDVVVVGNGGADFGVRGYVTAYDLTTGERRWRFFTVPHDPANGPQEQSHLTAALESWDANGDWSFGGGGTVWDGMAYDSELRLLYIGTGNASPYAWRERSPAGGDNLYLASVIAIHADTGKMAWYYQQVPGENWDYTSTAKMILAELTIDGRSRKVLLHAPKNGFFYVFDRASGELISAAPFADVNWTKGLDPETGRPIPNPDSDYTNEARLISPGMVGAHSWQPMSFSPRTGLVYIPVVEAPWVFFDSSKTRAGLVEGYFTVMSIPPEAYAPGPMQSLFGTLPPLAQLAKTWSSPPRTRGMIRAWDPVSQTLAWQQETFGFNDGGLMSTAGNLLFRGDSAGYLSVYAADTGTLIRRIEVGTGIMAAPMSYEVEGQQFVAVMAGFGGAAGSVPFPADSAPYRYGNDGRIIAFALGGESVPIPPPFRERPMPEPPKRIGDARRIAEGEVLFNRFCNRCHPFGRAMLPDLRRLSPEKFALFDPIVRGGILAPLGMARFDDVLSLSDAEAIRNFLIDESWKLFSEQN